MIAEEKLGEWLRDTQKLAGDSDEATRCVVDIIVPGLIAEVRRLQNVAAAAMCLCETSGEDSLHARLDLVAALNELDEVRP